MACPQYVSKTSSRILLCWLARCNPGACPCRMRSASHALYVWLARSPASMFLCQKQGISKAAEIRVIRRLSFRRNRKVRAMAVSCFIFKCVDNSQANACCLSRTSLCRGVVAAAAADFQPLVQGADGDGAIAAVVNKVGRPVGKLVPCLCLFCAIREPGRCRFS